MIIMRIKGGLGNQLFQYAAAYSLSRRLKQPFQFDIAFTNNMTTRAYKFNELNVEVETLVLEKELPNKVRRLKNKYVNKLCRLLNFSKHKCDEYLYWIETKDVWQPEFFSIKSDNLYVDGYFQSEKYFKEYRTELLKQFTPRYEMEQEYINVLNEIKKNDAVAVHVRRGDFKKDNNPFHYLLDETYYNKSIQYIREHVETPIFFWFSDDISWVKEQIGENEDFRFVSLQTKHCDIDEMMLMKNCNHIVAANSTFSWWATWLNENEDGIKIVPNKPYGMDDMIPPEWKKI